MASSRAAPIFAPVELNSINHQPCPGLNLPIRKSNAHPSDGLCLFGNRNFFNYKRC
jgi:hypothetical protein